MLGSADTLRPARRVATMSAHFAKARRIVIKIGSALIVDGETGTVKGRWLASLVDDIAGLRGEGRDLIIVSSGAIALGRRHLGLAAKPLRLQESQAAAAV